MLNAGIVQSFATLSIDGFKSGMKKMKRLGDKFDKDMQQKFSRVGRSLTLGLTTPLGVAGGAMINLASNAEETEAKFNTVFSSISGLAQKSAKTLTDSFGLSQKAAKELLGDTGDLLTGFGFTQDSALQLSEEVNKLAVDLASFTNFSGGAEGASKALTKALLGERESVKSLGISILEADVKAKILANTKKGLTFQTERQAKAFATLQLAQEQSKNAIGDFERTQGSFANQMRQLKAEVQDLAVAFGKELLPMANNMVGIARRLVAGFSGMSEFAKKLSLSLAGIAFVAGPTILFFGSLMKSVSFLVPLIPKLVVGIKALTAAMVANPYIAVGIAIAGIATHAAIAQKNIREFREEMETALTTDFNKLTLESLNKSIVSIQQQMRKIREGAEISGVDATTLDSYKKLEQKVNTLIQKRNDLAQIQTWNIVPDGEQEKVDQLTRSFRHLKDGLMIDPNDVFNKMETVFKMIDGKGTLVKVPVDVDAKNVQDSFNESMASVDAILSSMSPLDLGDKIFPPESLGAMQERLNALRESLLYATNPEEIERIKNELGLTQQQIDSLTGSADSSGQAMMGLANSIGQVFSQAVLHAKNLEDAVKNLLKQLASRAFVTGIGILLTGGLSEGKTFFDAMFGGLYHGGGMVPGSGDKMIRAKGGEMVLTKAQQKALNMGGGQTMMLNPNAIGQAIGRELDKRIRGVSDRKIFEMAEQGRYR